MKTQILVCPYRKTILSSHRDRIENNTEVSITACQSEEADQWLIWQTLHCLSSCFSYEKIVIHTIGRDVIILLRAYQSDIRRKNLNVLVDPKVVNPCVYHKIRTMILAVDHSTCVTLTFFMHFLVVTKCPAFILMENVRDGIFGGEIVPNLMRYSFVFGIDQMMWQKQTWMPLKASLRRCT